MAQNTLYSRHPHPHATPHASVTVAQNSAVLKSTSVDERPGPRARRDSTVATEPGDGAQMLCGTEPRRCSAAPVKRSPNALMSTKRVALSRIRTTLEPLLLSQGLTWEDGLQGVDALTLEDAETLEAGDILHKMLSFSCAIGKKTAFVALRPRLEKVLSDHGIAWEEAMTRLHVVMLRDIAQGNVTAIVKAVAPAEEGSSDLIKQYRETHQRENLSGTSLLQSFPLRGSAVYSDSGNNPSPTQQKSGTESKLHAIRHEHEQKQAQTQKQAEADRQHAEITVEEEESRQRPQCDQFQGFQAEQKCQDHTDGIESYAAKLDASVLANSTRPSVASDEHMAMELSAQPVLVTAESNSRPIYLHETGSGHLQNGQSGAIGIALRAHDGKIEVCGVKRGSVADKCGIRVSDQILSVDGRAVLNISLREVQTLISGPPDSAVSIQFLRSMSLFRYPIKIEANLTREAPGRHDTKPMAMRTRGKTEQVARVKVDEHALKEEEGMNISSTPIGWLPEAAMETKSCGDWLRMGSIHSTRAAVDYPAGKLVSNFRPRCLSSAINSLEPTSVLFDANSSSEWEPMNLTDDLCALDLPVDTEQTISGAHEAVAACRPRVTCLM